MTKQQDLPVNQVALLCGVDRNTVGYWIRTGKIRTRRKGRNFRIPVEEVIFFLKSSRKEIPAELARQALAHPFRAMVCCWDYWNESARETEGRKCGECIAFKNRLEVCFLTHNRGFTSCMKPCSECKYYAEVFVPRIQFVRQLRAPAAICKELYLWGANDPLVSLLGVGENEIIGMGLEHIVHPISLETAICNEKRRAQGDPSVANSYHVFLKSGSERVGAKISFHPLVEPKGSYCMIVEPDTASPSGSFLSHVEQ